MTLASSILSLKNVGVRIDDANDRTVGGRRIAFEWEGRLFAAAPEHQFALASTDRVECDGWLTLCFQVGVESLNDEELSPLERLVLDRGNDGADDAGYLHLFFRGLDIERIDDANYRGVDRAVFVTVRQTSRRTADDDHAFVKAGPDRIDGHNIPALVGAIQVDWLHDKQLFALKPLVLLCRHDRAQNACDDHGVVGKGMYAGKPAS